MSTPPIPFDRQANFTAFSTEQFPTVGQDLEAEFGKLQQVTGTTQSRLAEIQRDDGALKNQSVHPDALNQDVRALLVAEDITVRGDWAPGVDYAPKDIVRNTGGSYLAAVAHTSGADFDADYAAGKWLLLAGSGSTGPGFDGTFDQNVTIAPTDGQASLTINSPIKANQVVIQGQKEGAMRWAMVLGTNGGEAGGNAGSDFALLRYSDSGVPSNVMSVIRGTGAISFASRPSFGGNTPYDTGNFDPNTKANLTGASFSGPVVVSTPGSTPSAPHNFAFQAGGSFGGGLYLNDPGQVSWGIYASAGSLEIGAGVPNGGSIAYRSRLTNLNGWEATDFKSTSDERLKEDIRPLRRGLAALKRMRPIEYIKGGRREIGFSAQKTQRVIPESVGEGGDGYLVLSYGQVTALVANAVLQLEKRLMFVAGIAVAAAISSVLAWI